MAASSRSLTLFDTCNASTNQDNAEHAHGSDRLSVKLLEQLHMSGMQKDLLSIIKELLTDSILKDPDLWPWTRQFFSELLKNLWDDCDQEIQRKIEVKVIKQDIQWQDNADADGPVCSSLPGRCWCRSRAFLLHHYLPWNRSFFGKTKDPFFWVIYIMGLVPIHGLRVLLFTMILAFIVFPNHRVGNFHNPDEFQLVNFIVICKGAQFFSQGLVLCFCGSMLYFRCYAFQYDDLAHCIEKSGPGAGNLAGQLLDYLGSISLVWMAFLVLKIWSQGWRKGEKTLNSVSENVSPPQSTKPGGRLWSLLFWDMTCFAFSFAMFLLMVLICWGQNFAATTNTNNTRFLTQVRAALFWSRVIYSWLSLPFIFFTIPPLQQVLTHTTRTGFNAKGALVVWQLPTREVMTFRDHWQGFMDKHFPLLSGRKVAGLKRRLTRAVSTLNVDNQRAKQRWAVIRERLKDSLQCQRRQRFEDQHEFAPFSRTIEEGGDTEAGTAPALGQTMAQSTFPNRQAPRSTSEMLQSRAIGYQNAFCSVSTPSAQVLPAEHANTVPPSEDTTPLTRPLLDDSRQSVICGLPGFARSGGGVNVRSEGSRPVSQASILGPHSRSVQKVPILRLQWMWADSVGIAMWSWPKKLELLAAESERRREIRPVQVRRQGDRTSRTFPNARDAAQWIRSDEGFQAL